MDIEFATCVRNKALEYIQKALPSVEENDIVLLLDLIEKDILRVQDPHMYGSRIGIVPGQKYNNKFKNEINEAIKPLKILQEARED